MQYNAFLSNIYYTFLFSYFNLLQAVVFGNYDIATVKGKFKFSKVHPKVTQRMQIFCTKEHIIC